MAMSALFGYLVMKCLNALAFFFFSSSSLPQEFCTFTFFFTGMCTTHSSLFGGLICINNSCSY